jgi:cell division protein FtsB
MTALTADNDEVKRRTAQIVAEINQLRSVEGLPPIYRQALDDARYQLTRALRSSSGVHVDPNEGE